MNSPRYQMLGIGFRNGIAVSSQADDLPLQNLCDGFHKMQSISTRAANRTNEVPLSLIGTITSLSEVVGRHGRI